MMKRIYVDIKTIEPLFVEAGESLFDSSITGL